MSDSPLPVTRTVRKYLPGTAAVLAKTMYFLVNTLSVVTTDVTLTLTLLGTSITAESAVRVAPRIVPIDWVEPPGLTLIELGSSTTDTPEIAAGGGPT